MKYKERNCVNVIIINVVQMFHFFSHTFPGATYDIPVAVFLQIRVLHCVLSRVSTSLVLQTDSSGGLTMHSFKTKYKKHRALEQTEFAISHPGNLLEITKLTLLETQFIALFRNISRIKTCVSSNCSVTLHETSCLKPV